MIVERSWPWPVKKLKTPETEKINSCSPRQIYEMCNKRNELSTNKSIRLDETCMSSLSWVKWLEYRGDRRISLLPEVRFEGLCDLEHL